MQADIDRNALASRTTRNKDGSPIADLPGTTILSSGRTTGTIAKEMPSTTNPLRVTSGSTPSYITVQTPGGDMGYDAASYNPVVNENGIVTAVTPKQTKYTTAQQTDPELQKRLDAVDAKMGGFAVQDVAAAKQAVIAQYNVDKGYQQEAQAKNNERGNRGAMSTAAAGKSVINPVTGKAYEGAAGGRLQTRLNRQDFIEEQRAAGKTDADIRTMIQTLPPEQTGGASPTSDTTTTAPDAPGSTPGATTTTDTTKKPGATTTDPNAPAPVNPDSSFLRNLAATVEDPIMRAILNAEADRADLAAPTDPEMGFDQFAAGADAKAIAKPYDAIDKILQNADKRATDTYEDTKNFLKGQYDRNEKLMAQKEESIKQQLQFTEDKAVRDQADANRKQLDSETILLALQGGFGSNDGNREIATARMKGEQAIIDLNKEFGFKRTDVSLAFTEMHNQAFDNYRTAWLNATDKFETSVANLDIQEITNQQSKATAISGAYKDYVADIKAARKEQADIISGATKMVYDAISEERKLEAQDKALDKRLKYQEEAADRRLETTLNNQNRQQSNTDKKDERASADDIRTQYNGVLQRPDVQNYLTLKTSLTNMTSVLDGAIGSKDPNVIGAAKNLALTLVAKSSDPTTGVREGELTKFGKSQTWNQKVMAVNDAIFGGDMTGITMDAVSAYKEMLELEVEDQNAAASVAMTPIINSIVTHNNRSSFFPINPADILAPEFLQDANDAFYSYNQANERLGEGYNLDWDSGTDAAPDLSSLPPPKISGFNPSTDIATATIGDRQVTAQPYVLSALEQADAAMFAATGKHIVVNDHFRTNEQQAAIHSRLTKTGGRVAPPGSSYHEKGLALDIANWEEAAPYLAPYGLVNGLSDDMGHFSIGEMNPQFVSQFKPTRVATTR